MRRHAAPSSSARLLASAGGCLLCVACALVAGGCGSGHGSSGHTIVVNSLDDAANPSSGVVTFRSAMASALSGDTITFDRSLNGGTVALSIVGEAHSVLLGETYTGMSFTGYQERDYGASAIYARKSLTIDASALASGITIRWTGGDTTPARVLGIYGDLALRNVTVTGGRSVAQTLTEGTQPYTLGRGAGLAVWGTLTMKHCTVTDNKCVGDTVATRDRGAFGGGIYANGLELTDCVVSGNSAIGYGAAGGGIYSVGGADHASGLGNDTHILACSITGNRVTAQHAYGGGIFSLSGGPTNLATMFVTNCTIARNVVEDNPNLLDAVQFYYRGGGIYLGGGSLAVRSCTVVENSVDGQYAMLGGKPNMGGGGIAATIGNAHVVEDISIANSIVVGNTMKGTASDCFTGSLIDFHSYGHNLFGAIDFSQILVPVPEWMNLSRRHYPKAGDRDGVSLTQAVDAAGAQLSSTARSLGTDSGQPAVLWYPPASLAVRQTPSSAYTVQFVTAGYTGYGSGADDFLDHAVLHLRSQYTSVLGSDFASSLGDMTGVTWYGPRVTWPSEANNATWIADWHSLDSLIGTKLGSAGMNDDVWGTFTTGPFTNNVILTVERTSASVRVPGSDQRGRARGQSGRTDVGAIEG